jgi:enoyl-CoA hydratase/carnithine racemase
MTYASLTLTTRGVVAFLTLNAPRGSNAITAEMAAEVADACQVVRQDDAVRVLVVTGAGRAFSAGRFPPAGLAGGEDGPAPVLERLRRLRVASHVAAVEKPVVAALNGPAIGQGVELALACDLRLAANTASFVLPHLQHGLLPWDGGTQRLPRLIGLPRAAELLLTGRRMTARQALAIGLVHQVVPSAQLVAEATQLAQRIASGAPIAARYAKEAVLKSLDLPLEDGLRLEADLAVLLHSTQDRAEGLASFAQRRRPSFSGR